MADATAELHQVQQLAVDGQAHAPGTHAASGASIRGQVDGVGVGLKGLGLAVQGVGCTHSFGDGIVAVVGGVQVAVGTGDAVAGVVDFAVTAGSRDRSDGIWHTTGCCFTKVDPWCALETGNTVRCEVTKQAGCLVDVSVGSSMALADGLDAQSMAGGGAAVEKDDAFGGV